VLNSTASVSQLNTLLFGIETEGQALHSWMGSASVTAGGTTV